MKNVPAISGVAGPSSVDERLAAVYAFLSKNHHWNENLQVFWNRKTLSHCPDPLSRLAALLREIAGTQSNEKLDVLAQFWESLDSHQWPSTCPTVGDLLAFLKGGLTDSENKKCDQQPGIWSALFLALRLQKGWGPKTAALFVKNVIRVHRSDENHLHFLRDAMPLAKNIAREDILFLPVDRVIIHIFEHGFSSACTPSFNGINAYLQLKYQPDDMLIWDDLWFWGFVTQNSKGVSQQPDGKGPDRKMVWNPGKYWSLQHYGGREISAIEELAGTFIQLVSAPAG